MKKMTRRDFLRASAFAGGALLLPKRAWASSSDNLIPFTSDIALELSDSLGDCFAPGGGLNPSVQFESSTCPETIEAGQLIFAAPVVNPMAMQYLTPR